MSSPPTSPLKPRPRRQSRFTEGSESTPLSTETHTHTTPLTLQTILFEMDEHERALRQQRGGSSSSMDSFSSGSAMGSPKEEKRHSRRSEDAGRGFGGIGSRSSGTWGGRDVEGFAGKVKGRLRAFTGETRRDVKGSLYPGN